MKPLNNTKIASIIVGAFGLWVMTACQEDNFIKKDQGRAEKNLAYDQTSNSISEDTKKQLSLKLGKMVALSMADIRVRQLIKNEVLKKRDGDFNILFTEIKNLPLPSSPDGQKFSDILKQKSGMTTEQWQQFLNSMETTFPLAQIAVPKTYVASPIDWNVASTIPSVACHDLTGKNTIIPGFNSSGQQIQFDSFKAPDKLTAVISENERLVLVPKLTFNEYAQLPKYYESIKYLFYDKVLITDYISLKTLTERGYGDYIPGEDEYEVDCDGKDGDRLTNKDKDIYNKFKFTSVNNAKGAEPWTSGDFEMRVVIIIADADAGDLWTIEKFTRANRTDVINCNAFGASCDLFYYNVDADVVTWDPEDMGLEMKYEFIEEDNGNNVNLSLSATIGITENVSVSGSVSVSVPNGHDRLGSSLVEYCDNTDGEGTQYNTGSVYFYVNQ